MDAKNGYTPLVLVTIIGNRPKACYSSTSASRGARSWCFVAQCSRLCLVYWKDGLHLVKHIEYIQLDNY